MARTRFRNMTTAEREKFWLDLYIKYKTYPGTLVEFLKEHDISATAFSRWNKKFNDQRLVNIPNTADNNKLDTEYSPVAAIDIAIQQAVDYNGDDDLTEVDDFDKAIDKLSSYDNKIMASMELEMPDGFKIRLANHADIAMAIRLVHGIINHD